MTDKGYHSRATLKALDGGPWKARIAEPKLDGFLRWHGDDDARRTVVNNHTRLLSGVARVAFKLHGRSGGHWFERQSMRVLPNLSRTLLAALMLLATQAALATEIAGRVVGIADGDTLTVLNKARQQVRVRLAEIDTPEARQPYGNRARQALSDLAFGRTVRVVVQDTDRYGRTIGRIYEGATDVNAEMVRQGAAWVYRQYSRDPSLLRLEAEARAARRGLWALPEAERTAPWEWRAAERGGQRQAAGTQAAPQATRPSTAGGFTCSAKRYCREMTSCAEARFHLSQCGLSRLDGDRDGVPCESICR